MVKIVPRRLIVVSILSSSLFLVTIWAFGQGKSDPYEILEMMRTARAESSYKGTLVALNLSFSDEMGASILRVVRKSPYKIRIEYLAPLGDQGRVMVDDNNYHWDYIPSLRLVIKRDSSKIKSQGDLGYNSDLLRNNYKLELLGKRFINGRETIGFEFTPRFSDRPLRKIWLDSEHGVILRLEVYREGEGLISISFYADISFPSDISDAQFKLLVPDTTKIKTIGYTEYSDLNEVQKAINMKIGTPDYLPPGFELVGIGVRTCSDTLLDIVLKYTDGLSDISLFQRSSDFSKPSRSNKSEMNYEDGLLRVLYWKADGMDYSLVSELPWEEMLRIAESVVSID